MTYPIDFTVDEKIGRVPLDSSYFSYTSIYNHLANTSPFHHVSLEIKSGHIIELLVTVKTSLCAGYLDECLPNQLYDGKSRTPYRIYTFYYNKNKEYILNLIADIFLSIKAQNPETNSVFSDNAFNIIKYEINEYFDYCDPRSNSFPNPLIFLNRQPVFIRKVFFRSPVNLQYHHRHSELAHAVISGDLKTVEKILRGNAKDNVDSLLNRNILEIAMTRLQFYSMDEKTNNDNQLKILKLLILYGVDTNILINGLTLDEWLLEKHGDDSTVYDAIKILKAREQLQELNYHPAFFEDISNQILVFPCASPYLAKFIIDCNKKNQPKTNPIYHKLTSNEARKGIQSEFIAQQNKKLTVQTHKLSVLKAESDVESKLRHLINETFFCENEEDMKKYINDTLMDSPLKFIDILKIDNQVKGFIIYQLFFNKEKKHILVYLRLALVDLQIRKEFPRIMTILNTRIGFALQETIPDYAVKTFFEAISSVSVGILGIPGIQSSLLHGEINDEIPFIYQEIYPKEIQEKVSPHHGYYYFEDPVRLKEDIKQQVTVKNSELTTYTNLFCNRFDEYKNPLDKTKKKPHSMLVVFPNNKNNFTLFANRIGREVANPLIDLYDVYKELGKHLIKSIELQKITKEITLKEQPRSRL